MRPIVIVEDDLVSLRTIVRLVAPYRPVVTAGALSEAEDAIRVTDLGGLVTGTGIGTEPYAGFTLLEASRAKDAASPIAMLTSSVDATTVNRTASKGATLLCRPCSERELAPFLQRVFARELELHDVFATTLESRANAWSLTTREREILTWHVSGRTREQYLDLHAMSVNTYKSHVTKILHKSRSARMSSVVVDVLQSAVRAVHR